MPKRYVTPGWEERYAKKQMKEKKKALKRTQAQMKKHKKFLAQRQKEIRKRR